MPTPATTVTAYFDLSATGGNFFTLNSATKGVLDGTTFKLAGNVATDITADAMRVSVRRGRDSQLFADIPAGRASVQLQNRTRTYDPTYASSPYAGNIRPGKRVTIASAGVSIFDGVVGDWNLDYEVGGQSLAFAECVDALGQLGQLAERGHLPRQVVQPHRGPAGGGRAGAQPAGMLRAITRLSG